MTALLVALASLPNGAPLAAAAGGFVLPEIPSAYGIGGGIVALIGLVAGIGWAFQKGLIYTRGQHQEILGLQKEISDGHKANAEKWEKAYDGEHKLATELAQGNAITKDFFQRAKLVSKEEVIGGAASS